MTEITPTSESETVTNPGTSRSEEDLQTKINHETSKISWQELQKFYAKGTVIAVAAGADLIDVAMQVSDDNTVAVEQWLADGTLSQANDQQAALWHEQDTTHWAVVIAPWVLVQAIEFKI